MTRYAIGIIPIELMSIMENAFKRSKKDPRTQLANNTRLVFRGRGSRRIRGKNVNGRVNFYNSKNSIGLEKASHVKIYLEVK